MRSAWFIRWIMFFIVYILLPFDLVPEAVVGTIGYIDDIIIGMFILAFVVTIVGVTYIRNR